MNNTLKSVKFFNDIAEFATTGQIVITHNYVVWQLFLLQGKLKIATHSLQSAETVKYYLRTIGYDEFAKIGFLNDKSNENKYSILELINRLEKQEYINIQQKNLIIQKITENALEPLFWISQHENEWMINQKIKPLSAENSLAIYKNNSLEIESVIKSINERLKLWQKLLPIITSPHQCPSCRNPSLLEKSAPSGTLSIKVLKQLVNLMRGFSIRELAFFVKQDELKLAQLLSTYIKHGILQLQPPKSPFNLLPIIPEAIGEEFFTNQVDTKKIDSQEVKVNQKKYNIVCIDDSLVMLDIIGTYLDINQYNLISIQDPMKSISSLFKTNADLIIMDISMPGINGNRLCQILKTNPKFQFIPIILISGETNILNNDILESTGAKDFLSKPFTKESLVSLIHKYCFTS